MARKFYAERIKEISGWTKPVREAIPRELTARSYPALTPTRSDIRWAKRQTRVGSPALPEVLKSLLDFAKKRWPWLLGGGVLYTVLLAACTRRVVNESDLPPQTQ